MSNQLAPKECCPISPPRQWTKIAIYCGCYTGTYDCSDLVFGISYPVINYVYNDSTNVILKNYTLNL